MCICSGQTRGRCSWPQIRQAILTLVGIWTLVVAAEEPAAAPATAIDPLVKASEFGDKTVWSYHAKDPVAWKLFKPRDYGTSRIVFNPEGVRNIGKVPAPGVHPRIFFSPEDLPAIRKRLKDDRGGQEAWKNILAWSHTLRMNYDENADYAKPDWANGAFRVHGRVADLYRIGGYDPKRENYYLKLAMGEAPKIYEKNSAASFFNPAAAEAFRCLIDEDAEAGRTLAKATITAIKLEQDRRAREDKAVLPGQPPKPSTSRLSACSLGFIYDFIFNYMTPEQQKIVHDELVTLSSGQDNYGTFNNAEASRSNWATFSYWVFDLMAIEGEPGFNDLKYLGLYRGWRNFYTYSFFDSGAAYEAEGKLLFGLEAAVAMDRVGHKYGLQPLTQHPLPRSYYSQFSALAMLPTRDKFAVFDILGGMGGGFTTPQDLVVAKYLFPADKTIDFVYRALVEDDYRKLPSSLHSLSHQAITSAVFATAFNPDISPETLNLSKTFFCGQRAMMMTRSSWDKNATMLTMHVRGASGGHPYPDRNGIMLAGQGRTWVTIPGKNIGGWACNTVVIDGAEQTTSTPARVVDFVDEPNATFMTGDAKYCWDWVWSVASKNKQEKEITRDDVLNNNVDTGLSWKLVEQCFNDFSFTPSARDIYKKPLKFNAHWLAMDGVLSPVMRQLNTPVLKSFRTAGIVRGAYPYVLIVDDTERDGMPARYDWNLTLPPDVVELKDRKGLGMEGDIILAGKESLAPDGSLKATQPALLIRVMACDGKRLPTEIGLREKENLLSIRTLAASPNFKVLLQAFRFGDPLPMTTWDAKHSLTTIEFPGQKDTVTFSLSASGKTDVTVSRDGAMLVKADKPVMPLADAESQEVTARLMELPARVAELRKQNYNPARQSGFVAGWSFENATKGAVAPIPGSSQFAAPINIGDSKFVEGMNGRHALATGPVALQARLEFAKEMKSGPFTVACWVKTKPGPFMGSVINVDGIVGSEFIQGSLRFNVMRALNDSWPASMFSSWTHLAFSFDKKQICAYRNGVLISSYSVKDDFKFNWGNKMTLGGKSNYGDAEVTVQSVYIYNNALNAESIRNLCLWEKYGNSSSDLLPH